MSETGYRGEGRLRMLRRRAALGLIGGVVLGLVRPPTGAAAVRRRVALTWDLAWGGWTVGDLRLEVIFMADQAFSKVKVQSRGLAAMLTGFEGQSDALSRLGEGGRPSPQSYDSFHETKRYTRTVRLRFADGEIRELSTWKRSELQATRVPRSLWVGTVDPLTSILELHHWFQEARTGGPEAMAVSVLDGRRRYDVTARVLGRPDPVRDGGAAPYRLRLDLTPRAGFSDGDPLAQWAGGDGGERWIEARVAAGPVPLPVQLETHGGTLRSSLRLRESCIDGTCTRHR